MHTREGACVTGFCVSPPKCICPSVLSMYAGVRQVIKLLDESLIDSQMKCLKTSLNPAFLNRTLAPVHLYLSPRADTKDLAFGDDMPPPDQLFLPLPPILLRIFDIDIGELGEVEKEMIALVVDWSPANLDLRYRNVIKAGEAARFVKAYLADTGGTAFREHSSVSFSTDVNFAHEAIWYSLVNNEQIKFTAVEKSVAKSIEWDAKPRLLAAVGFTSKSADKVMTQCLDEANTAHTWKSAGTTSGVQSDIPLAMRWPVVALDSPAAAEALGCKLLMYHFDVDILGLRFLPTCKIDDTSDFVLQASGFWKRRATDVRLALSASDFPGPNVVGRYTEKEVVSRMTRPQSRTVRRQPLWVAGRMMGSF